MSSSDYNLSILSNSSNSSLEYEQINTRQNELKAKNFAADTFDIDIDMDEFDEEMKELQKELGKIKSYTFDFDFDNEEFRMNMEELKKELKGGKYSFHFDMDNFKEEMRELKEELKHLDIELDDLDIELKKLDGFMDDLREELQSDGLIDNKDDDFDLDLGNDEMLINGEPVPDELFKKYKDLYEEHFGKKLNGDYKLKIRQS
jgi:chromosome segregation ATPase